MEQFNNLEKAKLEYALRLGDSSLILGHRLSEWCGHGPILEQDIALTNIALDLVGRAKTILEYAAILENKGGTDDTLAFMRDALAYRNALLVEQPNNDFAFTIARQFLFDVYSFYFYEALKMSKDDTFSAIAAKSLKEISYHLRHSSEWILRLGDGTAESHQRLQNAIDDLWIYTGDLFDMDEVDKILMGEKAAPNLNEIRGKWENKVSEILTKATLKIPVNTWMMSGSRKGIHTEHLGYLLAEMQFLQRAYPNSKW